MKHGWIAITGFLVLAACAPDDAAQQADEAVPAAEPAMEQTMMPDTTDASLWAHLQDADYQTWPLWPGTGELYSGGDPHGMLLTTYVNDLARGALEGMSMELPAGAIVVKENFMPDSTLAAITVMHKVEGYAPDTGNWFWAKYMPDGSVEASGRVDGCIGCHGANASADYLMTARPQ